MSFTILKLGWEFPPNSHGGLGVACEGIVRGLTNHGVSVLMVLPRKQDISIKNCKVVATDDGPLIKSLRVDSLLMPYATSTEYTEHYKRAKNTNRACLYGENIFAEVDRYTRVVSTLLCSESFDLIHAHDWMSIKAGVLAKQVTGKPFIVHMHATEFDRTGDTGVHQTVYDIERWGMHESDKVIAVSDFTKQKIVRHYGINPEKIEVIHNAIDADTMVHKTQVNINTKGGPLVLFLGRLTIQKGPDYFISMAQKVLEYRPDITFVVAGSGDMQGELIDRVVQSGLSDDILFTGRLNRDEVNKMYDLADLFVLTSVSEPFGMTPLEAMCHGTPVIISKQSGVSEVVTHALKVDFWDVNELVNKVISVLDHCELKDELANNGHQEVKKFSWDKTAQRCIDVYRGCLG